MLNGEGVVIPPPSFIESAIESETITESITSHTPTIIDPLVSLKMWIEQTARSGVDEKRVREIVDQAISGIKPKTIKIKTPTTETKIEGLVHFQFEQVMKAIHSGVNIALSGSTATSKTTMAIQAAQALGKDYVLIRPMHSPSQAEGYNSATGEYIPSNLYRAHKEGKVAIFDEFDACDSQIVLVINSLMDNKTYTYPNGETVTNDQFQIIITMNTKGTGANRSFVGRNRLDAATLDRFVLIEIERDLSLEAALIGVVEPSKDLRLTKGGTPTANEWLDIVRRKRAEYEKSHPDKIVSTRAVRDGWKLLEAGIGLDLVLKMVVDK